MIDSKLNDFLNTYDCSDSAYILSDYMKKNMREIPRMSIGEVAGACYVSKGQVSKFVKKLGYESYSDFKDACVDYLEAQGQKARIFLPGYDLRTNAARFVSQYTEMLRWVEKNIDYERLEELITCVYKHKEIYLFAQGEARAICQTLQIELGNLLIPIGISNTEFSRNFSLDKDVMILVISINGRSFVFDKSVMRRILDVDNDTWVITCGKDIRGPKNQLVVPSENMDFNEFAMRFVVDLIIARLKQYEFEKK